MAEPSCSNPAFHHVFMCAAQDVSPRPGQQFMAEQSERVAMRIAASRAYGAHVQAQLHARSPTQRSSSAQRGRSAQVSAAQPAVSLPQPARAGTAVRPAGAAAKSPRRRSPLKGRSKQSAGAATKQQRAPDAAWVAQHLAAALAAQAGGSKAGVRDVTALAAAAATSNAVNVGGCGHGVGDCIASACWVHLL